MRIYEIFCPMTSDVKLSHCFRLTKVTNRDVFLTLKSFRKYHSETPFRKHHPLCECRKTSSWLHITESYCYLKLNFLIFELICEWTPPQIFFYGYRIFSYFFHKEERVHDFIVKNNWNWNFGDFRDLVLILSEAVTRVTL